MNMPQNKTNSTESPSGPFRTEAVLVLSLCHFIHDIYSSFLAPLLPLLIEKLSMSLTQAGLLGTVMQLPSLFNPFIGKLADRTDVRFFIILAPAMTAIPMSLIGLAPGYGILMVLLVMAGFSIALFHVPAPVMVSRLSGGKVGKGMSFFMAGGEMARALGPFVAVGAVYFLGLDGFYPVMIVGILASIWLFFKFRDVPIHQPSTRQKPLLQTFRNMKHILIPLSVILITRAFMHASMTTFLPTFIKLETDNLWLAGISLTVLEATGVISVLVSGTLSDRFGRRRILLFSLIGTPLCLFIFVMTQGYIRFIMLIFTGFTLLSTTPVMLALVQEQATDSPSAANGLFMMMSFLARSVIIFVVGIMGDLFGLHMTYIFSAAVGLVGLPFIFMLPKDNKLNGTPIN